MTPASPAASPRAAALIVTQADNGATIHLAVGEQLLVDLGSTVTWSVAIADQGIVGRVPGVLVIQGAQGIYAALAPGTTTLSAIGSPVCSSGACPQFRIAFSDHDRRQLTAGIADGRSVGAAGSAGSEGSDRGTWPALPASRIDKAIAWLRARCGTGA